MTPTIVLKDGIPFLATGSPGSSRIITSVLQIIIDVIDHGLNIAEATNAPRFHHQWKPDRLRVEDGFDEAVLDRLKEMGHTIEPGSHIGVVQSVMRVRDVFYGASDPRSKTSLTEGY